MISIKELEKDTYPLERRISVSLGLMDTVTVSLLVCKVK
jgi:hypothetical protein